MFIALSLLLDCAMRAYAALMPHLPRQRSHIDLLEVLSS